MQLRLNMETPKPFILKAYSKKELAAFYGIPRSKLAKWLNPINEQIGSYIGKTFTPKQVKTIVDHLGEP